MTYAIVASAPAKETPEQRYRRVHRERLLVKNREAMRARRADPEKRKAMLASQRRTYYRRTYGLEVEDLQAMYRQHAGRCAICERPSACPTADVHRSRKLHVDHDHRTGKIRGLLCVSCNTAIGKLGDAVGRFDRALAYIKGELF